MIAPAPQTLRDKLFGWSGVALLSACASILWAISDGQDLNFDLVTYHYYLGHTAFADRTALDFLPASFQGYQSPLPYALLAWLDSQGVPPAINAAMHALIHSLNLVVLFLLSRLLIGPAANARDRTALLAIWGLGAIAPVYWQLVGTSFADLSTGVLVLGGLGLVAIGQERRGMGSTWMPMVLAGAWLAGTAAGMRFHNAIYVAALVAAIGCARFGGIGSRIAAIASFVATAAGAWFIAFAPWGWRNFREFGNPVFPLFNSVFRSPDFPEANLSLTNFLPDGVTSLLTLPFRMAGFSEWIYVEKRLPDVRPALLVITTIALATAFVYRRIVSQPVPSSRGAPARTCVLTFFGVSAVLWLATSCNGRYGVVLFLLGGSVCGTLLLRLLPVRHVVLITAGVVAWQGALQYASHALPRWTSGPWTSNYFDWEVPGWMSHEPALFLTFGYQTASTLVPKTHPESRHVNLVGQYSLLPDRPGGLRVQRLIAAAPRPIFGVFDFYYTQQGEPAARSIKQYFGEHLRLWGLEFTATPCTLVALRAPADAWAWLNRLLHAGYRGRRPEYIVCELRTGAPGSRNSAFRELNDFRARLENFAIACPEYLGVPSSIVRHPGQWIVTSFASLEFRIEFYDSGAVALQQMRPPYAAAILASGQESAIPPVMRDCKEWPAKLAGAGSDASP